MMGRISLLPQLEGVSSLWNSEELRIEDDNSFISFNLGRSTKTSYLGLGSKD